MSQLSRFEYTIPAGGRIDIAVSGSAVTCTGGSYPFLITTNNGSRVALERGLGLPLEPFTQLGIENTADYSQTIEIYVGDVMPRDSRLSVPSDTVVGVVDGAFNTTADNRAFIAYSGLISVSPFYNHHQLRHEGSEGYLVVDSVHLVNNSGASAIHFYKHNTALTTLGAAGKSKLGSGADDTKGFVREQQGASLLGGADAMWSMGISVTDMKTVEFNNPIILGAGEGLLIENRVVNQITRVMFQYKVVDQL